jgi:hypothetical protein
VICQTAEGFRSLCGLKQACEIKKNKKRRKEEIETA